MVPVGQRLPHDVTANPAGRSENRHLHLISAGLGLPGRLRICGCVAFYAKSCLH
jgi:hypothetical protein